MAMANTRTKALRVQSGDALIRGMLEFVATILGHCLSSPWAASPYLLSRLGRTLWASITTNSRAE
jgi:hypothetical protein